MNPHIHYISGKKPKEYLEETKKQIMNIIGIDITDQPFDNLVSRFMRDYPKANHELLYFPGTFEKVLDSAVIQTGKTRMQVDYVEKTLIKSELYDYAIILLEHQTGRLTPKKLKKILKYYIQTIGMHETICYIYVLTGEKYEKFEDIEIEGVVFRINFVSYDEEKIDKTLNTLRNKDYDNEELSEVELLDFLFCMILTKAENFDKVINKSIEIFKLMDNVDEKYRRDIYSTLIILVKYHYRKNKNKIKELVTMILEIYNDIPADYSSFEKTVIYGKKLEQVIEDQKQSLQTKDRQIQEKDHQIQDKDAEIKRLKNIINAHPHIFN